MSFDWGSASAIVASLLLFVVGVWKILEDRSAIKRLERLTSIYASMTEQNQARTDIAKSVEYLAEKIRKSEGPASGWTLARNTGTLFVLSAMLGIAAFVLPTGKFPEQGNADFVAVIMLSVVLTIGFAVAYGSLLVQLLLPVFRRMKSRFQD